MIGASLSEPNINDTAVRNPYNIYYMVLQPIHRVEPTFNLGAIKPRATNEPVADRDIGIHPITKRSREDGESETGHINSSERRTGLIKT